MRVAVFTSGRADLGPLGPVMAAFRGADIEVEHIAFSGGELAWEDMAAATEITGYALAETRPDWLVLLGDRYETLGAAGAATLARVPIAHIHGGEVTEGSFDDALRNAITKLSHIHFVAHEIYAQRLLRMGEEPDRVHVVGAPGLDNIGSVHLPSREKTKLLVVTFHPETLGDENGIDELLSALREFPDYYIVFTGVNSDPGAERVSRAIVDRVMGTEMVGSINDDLSAVSYHSICRRAACIVGNSSSGIIEAPSLEVASVNIGDRQKGRMRGPSVFDCSANKYDIAQAIMQAMNYDGPYTNPYGGPGSSRKIAEILKSTNANLIKKAA